MFARTRRGLTLIELMVAVAFLGVGAVALLACVNTSITNQGYAQRRAYVLAAAQNLVDTTRCSASFGTISTGTSVSSLTVAGLATSVNLTQTVTLQPGYTDLYLVDVTATWNENTGPGQTRGDSLELTTYMRTNDT